MKGVVIKISQPDDFSPSERFTDEPKRLPAEDYTEILKTIATVDPLLDKAFKIPLSDETFFRRITEEILERPLSDGHFSYNGEIVISVEGKTFRPDILAGMPEELVNVEGQNDTAAFPFKRHLYHWAAIYATSINASSKPNYNELRPVTVIVIYKERAKGYPLKEDAYLCGDLVQPEHTNGDKPLLKLIAVNSKKWREATTHSLRVYLSLLHHGLDAVNDPKFAKDIDFHNPKTQEIYRNLCGACAKSMLTQMQEKSEKERDYEMETLYKSFISDEEKAACEAKGKAEGIIRGKILALYEDNRSIEYIMGKLGLTRANIESVLKEEGLL